MNIKIQYYVAVICAVPLVRQRVAQDQFVALAVGGMDAARKSGDVFEVLKKAIRDIFEVVVATASAALAFLSCRSAAGTGTPSISSRVTF